MEDTLRDLKLTRGEVDRLQKAFKDPEFCKLFAEYAEEISNPDNRRRYEEEIKLAEQGRGMDVEFVHPTPCYVLKTRHWPSVTGPPKVKQHFEDAPPLANGQKVFINICSSDKIGKPEFVTGAQTGGDGPNKGVHWSIPHSFSPPIEDLDKGKKRCLVCDVVFHPETIKISSNSPTMRRLLEATAIEGVHRQFQLCLGLSEEHARKAWASKTSCGGPEGQANILKCVRTLKGLSQKGPLRPTIIRRKRADYEECQQRAQEEERAVFEAARTGPNPKASLAALAKLKASSKEVNEGCQKLVVDTVAVDSKYKVPAYKIIHSTDFDMLHYRNSVDAVPPSRPNHLKIEITLTGIESAACLDLDVTSQKLHLQSEKPVAYQLDLDLPYEVDHENGSAKFNKAGNQLILTLPVLPLETSKNETGVLRNDGTLAPHFELYPSGQPSEDSIAGEKRLIEELPDVSNSTVRTPTTGRPSSKKRRKRKNRKMRACVDVSPECTLPRFEDAENVKPPQNASDPSTLYLSIAGLPTSCALKVDQVPPARLAVPKSYSYASTRFRQDPLSITLLLAIKDVLPDSLQLSWAPFNSTTPGSPVPYHLLLTCSSRGSGACTLSWGVVLQCPLNGAFCTTDSTMEGFCEQHSDQQAVSVPPENELVNATELDRPEILSCDFTHENVTLVLRKPVIESCDVWWDAVAVGRTMGPGLQKVPLVGLWQLSEPPQAPQIPNLSTPLPRLTIKSPECVELSFSRTQSPATQSPEQTLAAHPPGRFTSRDDQSSCASAKSLRLKGILKQRSTSESSLEEFHHHFGTSSIGGGDLLDSSEFPTESSGSDQEHKSCCTGRRRSNSGLPSSLISPLDPAVASTSWRLPSPPPRRRLRSVNFSKKDENVAFFPHDTVETLHNLLRNKQRNARRSQRRRRNNSYTAPSLPTDMGSCSANPPMNHKQRRQHTRQQKRLREGQNKQAFISPAVERTLSSPSPSSLRLSPPSSVPASQAATSDLVSKEKKADPTPNEPEVQCPRTFNSDVCTSKNVASVGPNSSICRWQDLPGAKNLLQSAQASSNRSASNLHITKCPVSLNAETIFELEDDC
nr:unnamed protein product [Spirometra erinaceieuropaei]